MLTVHQIIRSEPSDEGTNLPHGHHERSRVNARP